MGVLKVTQQVSSRLQVRMCQLIGEALSAVEDRVGYWHLALPWQLHRSEIFIVLLMLWRQYSWHRWRLHRLGALAEFGGVGDFLGKM